MRWISLVGAILLLSLGLAARSQEPTAGTAQKKVIKKVPMKLTAADSGEEMYREYCAVCHGKEGKGDGPAVSELKVAPPDLSMLAKHNNGKYPSDHVAAVLRFGTPEPAHGTRDMPIWGHLLGWSGSARGSEPGMVHLRIANLTTYIESLQVK
ncbi:MAG: c-type cytochrome [Acidobacteriia bacterium]|nr:c-type cytochrome [Terriglobia bacterium]